MSSSFLTRSFRLCSPTSGFEVGSTVRIYDRETSDYVVVTEVADKLIKWGTETPVNRRHRAAAPTHLEVLTFEIHVAMRDRREVFKGLQMHPSSRNYAPRLVSQRSRLIRLEDLRSKSPVPHNVPGVLPMTRRFLPGYPLPSPRRGDFPPVRARRSRLTRSLPATAASRLKSARK